MNKKKFHKWYLWSRLSLGKKLVVEIIIMAFVLFGCNWFIYFQVNQAFVKIDSVYKSNVNLTELSGTLEKVNTSMYEYLTIKSSVALEDYYRYEAKFKRLLTNLNRNKIDYSIKILEKNICGMSESYLNLTNDAIQAKRGRNVEKYKEKYEEAKKLYQYIHYYIYDLNSQQFINNANTYEKLQDTIQYMEISNSVIMFLVLAVGIVVLTFITKQTVEPLRELADVASFVGRGNFHVKVPLPKSNDEIGIVTGAFNKMVQSLEEYMKKTRESMEKELLMEAHLKEAQLKFFQSQINPHFLFNSLNAGAQLAMIEDAEKTCLFIEKMADFFRYNVKKTLEDADLKEEIEAVDNYVYILNVRFAGDIEYKKEIDPLIKDYRIPSMILQPLVENAVNHGIRKVEWKGYVCLKVKQLGREIQISIADNGIGMAQQKIQSILEGRRGENSVERDSTGVGLYNVKSRLELYYGKKDIMHIYSKGKNKGTEIVLVLPL